MKYASSETENTNNNNKKREQKAFVISACTPESQVGERRDFKVVGMLFFDEGCVLCIIIIIIKKTFRRVRKFSLDFSKLN